MNLRTASLRLLLVAPCLLAALVAGPVAAQAGPGQAPPPVAKPIANLSCSIDAVAANGYHLKGGEMAAINGGTSFPMTVHMSVLNVGSNDAVAVENSFSITRGRGKSMPMPPMTVLTDLAAGSASTHTFVLTKHALSEGDRVSIVVKPDINDHYVSPGKVQQLPGHCSLSFDVGKRAE